jgi:DNA-binding GntR family transcriptional regulator
MRNAFQKTDAGASAHEHVYRGLRSRIMHGQVSPGTPLTLRGVGQEFGVSMTPSREAIRRLAAEGALSISASGRISTPELSNERIEELAALRALIEVELASRALPRAHLALIDRLEAINGFVAAAVIEEDAVAYIRTNLEFHRTLYLRAQAPGYAGDGGNGLAAIGAHDARAIRAPASQRAAPFSPRYFGSVKIG